MLNFTDIIIHVHKITSLSWFQSGFKWDSNWGHDVMVKLFPVLRYLALLNGYKGRFNRILIYVSKFVPRGIAKLGYIKSLNVFL